MDYELKNKLVKIISKNILTPVIYMIENDNLLDFICFSLLYVFLQCFTLFFVFCGF